MEISEPKEVTRYGFTSQILHIKEQMCAAFPEDSPKREHTTPKPEDV